jgi:Bacterial Ig-like domain (group 3)/FG-GAP-like repeat
MLNVFFSASRRMTSALITSVLLTASVALPRVALAAPQAVTTTTLTLSAPAVTSPAVVTLTANVTANSAPLTGTGIITFCDASRPKCTDIAVLGTAQLIAGTAKLKIIPAIGTHTYKAIFSSNGPAAGSTSPTVTLTVNGLYKTTTAIAATGNPSGYNLTATVVGYSSQPPVLAGNVTFQDTTTNTLLGVEPLGTPVFAQSLIPAPGSPIYSAPGPDVAGVGDFNEDGMPDLAIVNSSDDTFTIMLGNPDGTFNAVFPPNGFNNTPCANPNYQSNCAIAVGDFNHDGHADLALTSGDDSQVSVFKGDGTGKFTQFPNSPITTGNFPEAVKVADFNNDGFQDLAVANLNDGTVSILLGNGDGTFTAATGSPVTVGGFPFFLAAADLNEDGTADLAVVDGRGNTMELLQGNGDGTFTPFASSPITFPPIGDDKGYTAIVAADFTGDGHLDLAIADFDANVVVILNGNGTGAFTFSPQSPVAVGSNPFSLTALDYNGDGHADLAVGNFANDNGTKGSLSLLINEGAGTFTALAPLLVGSNPNDVVTADFNQDGKPDLAIPDFDTAGVLNNTGNGTYILLNQVTQTATASVTNVVLPGAGVHVVQASYPANASFAASSATIDLQGLTSNTTLTLTDNPTAQLDNLPVTFTAQLNPISVLAPTGTVTFYSDNGMIGTSPLSPTGTASFTTSALGDGNFHMYAKYSGDVVYAAAQSAMLPLTISDLQVTRVGKNNTTIIPGTTVVYTLQVAPVVASSFLYDVAFTATGLPAGAAATFSPATLAAGASSSTVTMTVTTAATALNEPPAPFRRLPLALGLLLPLFGARAFRRRLRQVPSFVVALVLAVLSLAAVTGLSGCSGAGLFAAKKIPYTITVTATEGNAVTGTLSRSTGVPLAIQ